MTLKKRIPAAVVGDLTNVPFSGRLMKNTFREVSNLAFADMIQRVQSTDTVPLTP